MRNSKDIWYLIHNLPFSCLHRNQIQQNWTVSQYIRHSLLLLSLSVTSDSLQPHELQHATLPCPSLSPEFPQTHVHRVSDAIQHLILCRPLLLPPSIFPSIRVFSNESVLRIRWPKYWSFRFSISPSNEYSGLISFRMDRYSQKFVLPIKLIDSQQTYLHEGSSLERIVDQKQYQ